MKIKNKSVKIILLSAALLLSLIPWYIIISANLNRERTNTDDPPPAAAETPGAAEDSTAADINRTAPETKPDTEPDTASEVLSTGPVETDPPAVDPTEGGTAGVPEDPEKPPAAVSTDPQTEDRIINISAYDPQLSDSLDRIAGRYNCAAVSLAAYNGDSGEYFVYNYGYADIASKRSADPDTMFRVASLSKLTTVICAMVLSEEGKLDFDEDISIYLGYDVRIPGHENIAVTVRMLMQHTSSIYDSNTFLDSRYRDSAESTQKLLEAGSSYRRRNPGSQFEYSNFGYAVLGAVCEMISGKTLDLLAREVLFDPLGVDAAYEAGNLNEKSNIAAIYDDRHSMTMSVQRQLDIKHSGIPGRDHHLAQGNLTIKAADYTKILAMLGNDGSLHGVRIISQESVQEIHRADVRGEGYYQGLATRSGSVSFIGDDIYWHTGSGFGTYAQYIYSTGSANRGVAVITTGADTGRSANGMINICTELSSLLWRDLGF